MNRIKRLLVCGLTAATLMAAGAQFSGRRSAADPVQARPVLPAPIPHVA